MKKTVVGIDISKSTFDVAFLDQQGTERHLALPNSEEGFVRLTEQVDCQSHFVMEATGAYHYPLACFLHERGFGVSVINPLVAKRFCQMRLQRNKTDKSDAFSLREYGQCQPLEDWHPNSDADMEIRHLYGNMARLTKNRTALSNQLGAYHSGGILSSGTRSMMEDELRYLDERIALLEKELESLVMESHPEMYANMRTVPGIGPKSALLLLVACRGFKDFQNYRQVIAYIGTSPKSSQSGTSIRGKARICKLGMGKVRATLYMAVRAAIKYNPACKALYERLIGKGKAYRVARIAVLNKLVKQAFAIAKSGVPYRKDYATGI